MHFLLPCTAFHSCFPQFQSTVSSPPWHEATLALVGTLWCDLAFVQQKSFALFLYLLTIRQMFLYVSCLSQALSLPRQAILSLPCFLIIACALKQTPLQGFSSPLSLPAQSWTDSMACKHRAAQKRHARGWQSSGEEGKAACYFRPLLFCQWVQISLLSWWQNGC